jgi:hypothetical protein
LEYQGINVFVAFPKMIDYLIAAGKVVVGDSVRVRVENHCITNKDGTAYTNSEGASFSVSMFKKEV